jgi:hypothetical protein
MMTDLTAMDADEILVHALKLASKGVQADDGQKYLVPAADLVDYAETISALVADHKALRSMHNELRTVANAHIAELEAEVARLSEDVLVEGSFIPVKDWPTILGRYMRDSAEYAREAKAAVIQAEKPAPVKMLDDAGVGALVIDEHKRRYQKGEDSLWYRLYGDMGYRGEPGIASADLQDSINGAYLWPADRSER